MEFLSRSDDKKLRWIITESCPQPHLINEKPQSEEVKGGSEVKADGEVKDEEGDTLPKESSKVTSQEGADSEPVDDGATVEVMEEGEKHGPANKAAGRGGWRGRRGRGRGDRGAILLTSLEQEMLLWALGGFQPVGPEGLKPSPEHQVRLTELCRLLQFPLLVSIIIIVVRVWDNYCSAGNTYIILVPTPLVWQLSLFPPK